MIEVWGLWLNGRYSDLVLSETVADFAAPAAPEYCWVGTDDAENDYSLKIWAEENTVWMQLDGTEITSDRVLNLYSTIGTLCAQNQVRLVPGSASSFNISHLPPALYLLELIAPDQPRLVQPFVKPQ